MTLTPDDMIFGMELVLDIDACDLGALTDHDGLVQFAGDLVELLKMRAYGDPIIEHFGHDDPRTSGFTLVQLIETSSIVGHFSDELRRAHLNIFSCRAFDPDEAAQFCAERFGGRVAARHVLIR
jgi:S-adenosylmethionine decarboxylase